MKWYRYKDSISVTVVSAKFADPDYGWKNYEWDLQRHPDCETFMDFKTWLTFYNADIKGWYLIDKCIRGYNRRNVYMPYYHGSDQKCHFIKFINAREYRKFKRWYKQHIKDKNSYENLQEQTELAKLIREQATETAKRAVKEQKEAEEKVKEFYRSIANTTPYEAVRDNKGRLIWRSE